MKTKENKIINNIPEDTDLDISKIIRTRRMSRGLSIDDAERDTRISRKYLEALESGEFSKMPGTVAIKGFLKIYTDYLGLDSGTLVSDFMKLWTKDQPQNQKTKIYPRIYTHRDTFYMPKWIYAIIIIILLGVVVYFSPQCIKRVPVSIYTKPLQLTVDFKEKTWIVVSSDEKNVQDGLIDKGELKVWDAESKFRIRVGDATAVKMLLNGHEIRLSGRPGETKDFEFDRSTDIRNLQ